MKKLLWVIFSLLTFGPEAKGQAQAKCNIEASAKTSARQKTFVVDVAFMGLGKLGSDQNLKLLQKDGLQKVGNFEYSISFTPIGCKNEYYLPSKDRSITTKLYRLDPGSKLRLTCIYYKKYPLEDRQPYFVITKVKVL